MLCTPLPSGPADYNYNMCKLATNSTTTTTRRDATDDIDVATTTAATRLRRDATDDAVSMRRLQRAVDQMITSLGCTVVLIAHRLSTVMSANQIVVLEGGRVIERGSHQELVVLAVWPDFKTSLSVCIVNDFLRAFT